MAKFILKIARLPCESGSSSVEDIEITVNAATKLIRSQLNASNFILGKNIRLIPIMKKRMAQTMEHSALYDKEKKERLTVVEGLNVLP